MRGYLGMGEAARELGISKATLSRRIRAGEIAPDRTDRVSGRRWFLPETIRRHRRDRYEEYRAPAGLIQPKPKFAFIDLFAGIGGIRLGFEAAGGECVFSSEIDKFAARTYSHMFRDRTEHTPAGDITKIDAADIPAHDILCGGFPCQPFSIAGVTKYGSLGWKHGFEHPTKGTLFFHIVRILAHHRPKAFFLENVKNLKSHNGGRTWEVIEHSLEDLGYAVSARVLDARLLLPQHRERIFIVGIRKDLGRTFVFPEIPPGNARMRDILEDTVDARYTLTPRLWEYLQAYAEKHRAKGNGFGYGLVDLDGVSRTLSARYYKDGAEILVPQPGGRPRRLTPAECARLQGFPPRFEKPVVSDCQAYRQFGNAVPVPLVAAVGRSLVAQLAEAGALPE